MGASLAPVGANAALVVIMARIVTVPSLVAMTCSTMT
eukprot:CAMPEP_0204482428 /NCGR_PEP_ID=MMETSP0471-20130131/50923_1 /ASSEMBLY_ACC=CAM_ASM_000602 /TAXON_ID=2969 /ORGANISM="Oxyrrhis marina" /LENGTH=36 /DNA_ID= /DNA_START= /DNA_END= /DNA_ORIENTATION=